MNPTSGTAASTGAVSARTPDSADRWPVIAIDLPVVYEDEGQDEMGESELHTVTDSILFTGFRAHLASQARYRVFSNLNLYYHRVDREAYVSPDEMVVSPPQALAEPVQSYRIGEDGPAPTLTVEILSRRSAQQQDLTNKPVIYADLGVSEHILVDAAGTFLAEKLLLKRLQSDRSWLDTRDRDGGVTSRLGFRIVMEADGLPRVLDAATGRGYLRPQEAQAEADARRHAEERVRDLEAELTRLREGRRGGSGDG